MLPEENTNPNLSPVNNPPDRQEQLQEFLIIVQDNFREITRAWWMALVIVFILCIPLFYLLRWGFASLIVHNHKFPIFLVDTEAKVPLTVIDKQIVKLTDNSYAGFVKIKNANSQWGVIDQKYNVIFRTLGGTEVTRMEASTYIAPGSEKILVFNRFTAEKTPATIEFNLGNTNFIRKPDKPDPTFNIQRVDFSQIGGNLVVSAAVTNDTPFTISRTDLPVIIYDKDNKIVGVNYTNINNLAYHETRTFQFTWPSEIPAVRAEILPQINIFANNIYQLPAGQSQFDNVTPN